MFLTKVQTRRVKNPKNVPKYMPIDTNQHNPTKIIDGCQIRMEISMDKKTAVAKNEAMQNGSIEKEEMEFPACATLWQGIYIRWQHLIFFYLCTCFSCIKKIGQSCVCWAVGP